MVSLKDAGALSRILCAITLLVMAMNLSGCATVPSGTKRAESEETLIFEKYEGMSAEEIAAAGDKAWQEGELENAVFIYMQSLAIAEDPNVWLKVGRIQQHSGQTEFALRAFARVIELDPQNAGGHEHIGMLFLASRQKDLAAEHLEKAVELDERRWVAYNALGVLSDASGEYENAIGYYEAALEYNPNSAMLLTNMGYSYYLSGQLEEAERLFKIAIGIDRLYLPAKRNLGLARARSGRYDSAVKILENVMERPKALNDVGYIAFVNEDFDEAERLLSDAVRLSPIYYEIAYENLERVKKIQGELSPREEDIQDNVGRSFADTTRVAAVDYRQVGADRLNVRRTDSIDAPIIGYLAAKNRVRALEEKGAWTFVSYSDESGGISISGWVMSEYLTTSSDQVP